jgi:hypothetical protein
LKYCIEVDSRCGLRRNYVKCIALQLAIQRKLAGKMVAGILKVKYPSDGDITTRYFLGSVKSTRESQ